jgi:hypothetical protein
VPSNKASISSRSHYTKLSPVTPLVQAPLASRWDSLLNWSSWLLAFCQCLSEWQIWPNYFTFKNFNWLPYYWQSNNNNNSHPFLYIKCFTCEIKLQQSYNVPIFAVKNIESLERLRNPVQATQLVKGGSGNSSSWFQRQALNLITEFLLNKIQTQHSGSQNPLWTGPKIVLQIYFSDSSYSPPAMPDNLPSVITLSTSSVLLLLTWRPFAHTSVCHILAADCTFQGWP